MKQERMAEDRKLERERLAARRESEREQLIELKQQKSLEVHNYTCTYKYNVFNNTL